MSIFALFGGKTRSLPPMGQFLQRRSRWTLQGADGVPGFGGRKPAVRQRGSEQPVSDLLLADRLFPNCARLAVRIKRLHEVLLYNRIVPRRYMVNVFQTDPNPL